MMIQSIKYLLFFISLFFGFQTIARQLAFPGAQGFGAYTQGGRYGKIIEVTNLNDNGPGSLRAAIDDPNPRTIVFRVSGTIALKSMLTISSPYCTIAGQTAPGDGICLKDFPFHIQTNDVIVRFIRVRPGIASGLNGDEIDGIEIRDSRNIIIDHCTISWTVDEGLNTWKGTENITVQWCIIAEPLNHSIHIKGAHGFAGSIGGKQASYLHNLLAHAPGRNPSIGGNSQFMSESVDFRNNVIFNYGHRTCDGKPGSINFVGNYYKPGPQTSERVCHQLVRIDNAQKYGFQSRWYIAGNVIHGYPEAQKDNWKYAVNLDEGTSQEINRLNSPLKTVETEEMSAERAFKQVVKYAGVVVPKRDSHENKIILQLQGKMPVEGDGVVDTVEEAGGWPVLESVAAPADSDHDGMPDEWELKNKLNPNDPSDSSKDSNRDGYTNVEEYLNSLVVHICK
jgi:pectate lyase